MRPTRHTDSRPPQWFGMMAHACLGMICRPDVAPAQRQKRRPPGRRVVRRYADRALLPVLLDARGAQAGKAVLVDRILPGQEFLDRQRVAAASFLERKQAAAHGSNDLGLASDD